MPPSFFRFRLTTDTLDLGYILPTAGRIRDFHPLERALTGRTNKIGALLLKGTDFSFFIERTQVDTQILDFFLLKLPLQ